MNIASSFGASLLKETVDRPVATYELALDGGVHDIVHFLVAVMFCMQFHVYVCFC